MNLPIRYSPMSSYFQLQWPPIFDFLSFSLHCRSSDIHCADVTFPNHRAITIDYTLYPSRHQPSTTLETSHMTYGPHCYIFLSQSLLPDTSCHGPTDHKSLHHTVGTLPYVSLHRLYLRLLYLLRKEGSFSPELRLKFILSHCFTSLRLTPSPYFALLTLHSCTILNLHLALLHIP